MAPVAPCAPAMHFNSRPHGGRRKILYHRRQWPFISTHALTEGDQSRYADRKPDKSFQLTPSRRATYVRLLGWPWRLHFNSRPHGGRHDSSGNKIGSWKFQLTPSRRATKKTEKKEKKKIFQLTPSRRATASISFN